MIRGASRWRAPDLRVLLIDDNPDDRALVRRVLRRDFTGLKVTEVGTAAGLEDALRAEVMDVVVTDYLLRWGNGLDVLDRVRVQWPTCAVVMFTGTGSEKVAVRAMKNGLDDYVVKSASQTERLPVAIRRSLDRRARERRARAAEAQIQALFDRLPAGVYRSNQDNRLLYANQALADIAGVEDPQELIGMDLSGDFVDSEATEARRKLKGEGTYTSTVRLRRPADGKPLWVRDSGRLVRDVDGTPMYYEGVIQDVTEAHEAQLEVQRQSRFVELLQAVTATANEYEVLDDALVPAVHVIREALGWSLAHVHRVEDGVLRPTEIWTSSGRFREFRDRSRRIEFREGEGLPGRALARRASEWMEDLAHHPDFIRLQPDDDGTFASGMAIPVLLNDEVLAVVELFHTSAQERDPALLRVLDKVGLQLGRVAEREQAERRRREMEARAREAQRLDAVGRLAGGIAHDFNNLLTVIRSQADLMLMDLPQESGIREEVGAIQMAADRAAGLTSQLLAFSREQELETRAVDLDEVVTEVVRLLERIIGEDIEIVTTLAGDLPPIEVDPTQLEQVLVNLAVNARHAMPAGGTFTLETAVDDIGEGQLPDLTPGRYVSLAVSDTGVGMDQLTRERIFEPFFTTKSEEEGTGLGLAMAHGLLKQIGGSIHVESEPDEGATFFLHFPPTDREPVRDSGTPVNSGSAVTSGTGRILVVEDETAVRSMIQKSLERSGFSVRTVPDAETGLHLLESDDGYDLLLTDLLLPGMTGIQLARRVGESHPDLRIVVMSGYTEGAVGRDGDGLPPGATFIQKPFTVRDLTRAVRETLAGD